MPSSSSSSSLLTGAVLLLLVLLSREAAVVRVVDGFSSVIVSSSKHHHHVLLSTTTRLASSSTSSVPQSGDDEEDGGGDAPTPFRRKTAAPRSQALPFLACPRPLVDCGDRYAGNVGFDPLGFVQNPDQLAEYREAEIKHARLAMLAAAGWPLSELYDRNLADALGVPSVLDATDRVPSVLNGGLDKVSPVFWGFCLGLTAAIDLYGVSVSRRGDPAYLPGQLGFDPLGLYPAANDAEGRARMELAEIKHGRLAMIAVAGYAVQEYATKLGVVDETPFFFRSLF